MQPLNNKVNNINQNHEIQNQNQGYISEPQSPLTQSAQASDQN